ncbi:hypothetical protein GRI91_01420 [Altererythrobacter endophyticus]|uniref:Phytoene synthase n=1 Tax=Altericroceibacterium endophyticum TaxID=1808508 RepID=A0A6I4T0F7_9SPHN|nr:hypothetical protein [Altericroceibacterium endophyticum]
MLESLPLVERLALAYGSAKGRDVLLPIFACDARLSQIVRQKREPVLAQMRLAWWREMLEKPADQLPKGDAVLDALSHWPERGQLASLVSGWEMLLQEELDAAAIEAFVDGRANAVRLAALQIDSGNNADVQTAAQYWALGDLAANLGPSDERERVRRQADDLPRNIARLPRSLRPVFILGKLGQRALDADGAPLLSGPKSMLTIARLGIAGF